MKTTLTIFILGCIAGIIASLAFQSKAYYEAPQKLTIEPVSKTVRAVVSAYNPIESQTDSTPDINASGRKVQDGDVANNCLKFGTIIELKGKQFVVRDRMNSRYDCLHYDILMFDKRSALEFGRQELLVKIF